ncbi:SDR family NAD(P)-dependent oxidoreductase [Nocardia terpenica]|uniref:Short-chain dehydrogenase n=1 Tax=Nocardia terpenica TaxID=455432 RepID=A0A161XI20_9NOCA|nr:SDR family NAD(P)-dependent oxidoreductase [Nocardia terpenica]KZM73268.1 short-chain dehydrogenase [Nocardia terpenica]NQE91721.1 SDR family NAD(P)-dependent oxidoreductase [Nocardia terpenica]
MITLGKAVLVTGANRGIGKELVEEALARGAARVYAGTRRPLVHPDERVVPLLLDVTDAAHIRAAAERVESLDILINNAGVVAYDDLTDPAVLDHMLAVNFYGVRDVTQALLPKLIESEGAIATNVSLNAIAAFALNPSYSVSKAAAFNLMQSLRAVLAPRGVTVHAIVTGPTDTDMTAGIDVAKASPKLVAHSIFDGIEKGDEDIFPDPMSQPLADGWRNGSSKELERRLTQMYAHFTRQE